MHTATPPRHSRIAALALVLLFAAGFARTVAAQGTDRLFPDPMGFEQMSDLLAPLELSDEQRQFTRQKHREYLDAFRQLREKEIKDYLESVGTVPLEYERDRSKIAEGSRRINGIISRIDQIDQSFFDSIRPMLSEAQASKLPRIADRRTRQRLSSSHGSWDWSMPSLLNLDVSRIVLQSSLDEEELDEIDELFFAYEQSITPIFARIHANRLALPLAHHDQTAAARRAFEQRMADLESRLSNSTSEDDRNEARRLLRRLVSEGDYWQPASSSKDLTEAKAIRSDLVRISKLNRQLLRDLASILKIDSMRALERTYERRAFGMLRVPGDPLRTHVSAKLSDEQLDAELRGAIESLYDSYTTDRRPLVSRLIASAEEQEFLGTAAVFRLGPPDPNEPENPVEQDRQQIRDLNERTLRAFAALTGEEIPTGGQGRLTLGDGPIMFEGGDGDVAVHVIGGEGGGDGGEVIELEAVTTGVFITSGATDLSEGGEVEVFSVQLSDVPAGDFSELRIGGGVSVPRGWLPGSMTRDLIRNAALTAGLAEEQLPIVDAMYEEYAAAFAELESSMLSTIKEGLSELARPRRGDEITDSDIDSAFAGVRTGMDAIGMVDQNLFANLGVVVGVSEEDPGIQHALRERKREGFRHLGSGMNSMRFMGGADSSEHEADLTDLTTSIVSEPTPEVRRILDQYSQASVELMEARWHQNLQDAAAQAKQIRQSMRSIERADDGSVMAISRFEMPRPDDGSAKPGPDYEKLLRELNRDTLAAITAELDEQHAYELTNAYKRRAFPTAYRDRGALHALFDKAEQLELERAKRSQVQELKLHYLNEYDAITERIVQIIRDFSDSTNGGAMSPMIPPDPGFFEQMQRTQQAMEVERFARRSLNESTRQAMHDLLDPEARQAVGLRDDS